jgi:hypothetical protein
MATEGVVEETSTASMVGEWDVAVATTTVQIKVN